MGTDLSVIRDHSSVLIRYGRVCGRFGTYAWCNRSPHRCSSRAHAARKMAVGSWRTPLTARQERNGLHSTRSFAPVWTFPRNRGCARASDPGGPRRIEHFGARERYGLTVEQPLLYPMYLLPVRTLLDLSVLPPHEMLLQQDKLVQWQPTMRSVFYVSLEWSSNGHADPRGKRLDVLKRLLSRMVEGRAAKVESDYTSQAAFGKGLKITSADWRELVNDARVWISFCSAPTVPSASLEAAMRSFPGYMERSTHFFALCAPTKYENDSFGSR